MNKTRPYEQRARAASAARTADAILAAAAALWREQPPDALTLRAIADRAGVTVQTVLRRFGSKEGVVAAAIEADAAHLQAERDATPVGDADAALAGLLAHYERDGETVRRTLAVEDRLPVARAIAQAGRATHRAWCARVFAPFLPPLDDAAHAAGLDAFVAATDLSVWWLLRRDLGRSADETAAAMRALLAGLLVPSS